MEIDWIIVAAEVIIILGIMIIAAKILLVKYKKCVIEFNNKNYNYLIKNAKIVSVFSSKNTEKHYMYFMIAVSYYENGDDESFLEYINRIKHKKVINRKYFWVSIYYLLQGEEKYQEYYAQLKQSDSEEEKEYFMLQQDNLYYRANKWKQVSLNKNITNLCQTHSKENTGINMA